jgi:hypothetical protein
MKKLHRYVATRAWVREVYAGALKMRGRDQEAPNLYRDFQCDRIAGPCSVVSIRGFMAARTH